jgi:hypothetical protein
MRYSRKENFMARGTFGWEYPPGVTGNEPQISGIWPAEATVDAAIEILRKVIRDIEGVASDLDDQNLLPPKIELQIDKVQEEVEGLIDDIEGLIQEDDPDREYDLDR